MPLRPRCTFVLEPSIFMLEECPSARTCQLVVGGWQLLIGECRSSYLQRPCMALFSGFIKPLLHLHTLHCSSPSPPPLFFTSFLACHPSSPFTFTPSSSLLNLLQHFLMVPQASPNPWKPLHLLLFFFPFLVCASPIFFLAFFGVLLRL